MDVDDADLGVLGRFPSEANLKKPFRELPGSDIGSGDSMEPDDGARVVRLAAKLGA